MWGITFLPTSMTSPTRWIGFSRSSTKTGQLWMIRPHSGICAVETQLDSSFRRGQRKNRQGRLLLPALYEAETIAAGKENRTRANQRKPKAILCCFASSR